MSLLKEINDLRKELKTTRSVAHDLEAALKIARKNGFDDQSILAGIRAPPPPSGIGKIEATDNARVIEIQKVEISKLRSKVRELECTPRPVNGERLPPLKSSLKV